MKLPWMTLAFVVAPNTVTACCVLPDTTLPRTLFVEAPFVMLIPLCTPWFGTAAVPPALRPM